VRRRDYFCVNPETNRRRAVAFFWPGLTSLGATQVPSISWLKKSRGNKIGNRLVSEE